MVEQYKEKLIDKLGLETYFNLELYSQENSVKLEDVAFDVKEWDKFRQWENEKFTSGELLPTKANLKSFDVHINNLEKNELVTSDIVDDFKKQVSILKERFDDSENNQWYGKAAQELEAQYNNIVYTNNKRVEEAYNDAASKMPSVDIDFNNLDRQALSKMSSKDINQMIVEKLEKQSFDRTEDYNEFLKYISGFRMYEKYTMRNRMLLFLQTKARCLSSICASFNEWKTKGTFVKKGESGMMLCVPNKVKFYYKPVEGQTYMERMPTPTTVQEKKEYAQLEKEGKIKSFEKTYFSYPTVMFSMTQTNMKESDRIEYLKRWNEGPSTEEENLYYDRVKNIAKQLGLNVVEADKEIEASGYVSSKNEIYVNKEMPKSAQLRVITHEMGHFMMRHLKENEFPTEYRLSHSDKELQAELFSNLVLAGLGITASEKDSLNYLNSYLGTNQLSHVISDVKKDVLFAHINLVSTIADTFRKELVKENINAEDLKQLEEFEPDFYKFDKASNKATIVTRASLIKQELQRSQEKIKEEQQKMNEASGMELGE